ncbi:hypothetical protein DB44_DP00020 [Candidatus Protochlamydia amoebophila]|uniref:Uncharacterized protein n=1 Tax=Candidatus Protochlamydia amoebophila TaxID=362787 RepID=A0A0C1H982_9BACT|nr:hypothetical protein DB44_DP00020 [Candidatus Protochlamydia amoebophila]
MFLLQERLVISVLPFAKTFSLEEKNLDSFIKKLTKKFGNLANEMMLDSQVSHFASNVY